MTTAHFTLLPEWAEQEAVILAWPHANTDWVDNLFEVRDVYLNIIKAINATDTPVILLCPNNELDNLSNRLNDDNKVLIVASSYNDTWVRDYAFLTASFDDQNYPLNFLFNGWGKKFDAELDNAVNTDLAKLCQNDLVSIDIVLEGGAIEIDENQHLLSTSSCLLNPLRNQDMTLTEYEQIFRQYLGAKQVSVFANGHLEGDDTDGHIDTLVRFTPLMGVLVQGADNRPNDEHFADLFKLQHEVGQCLPKHKLYSLPLAYLVNTDGQRLPASYANFLILNRHIIMPIYAVQEDDEALRLVQKAYPNYRIIPIDCSELVKQNGSLHCISMQVPTNTLKTNIVEQARNGVSIL